MGSVCPALHFPDGLLIFVTMLGVVRLSVHPFIFLLDIL